VAMSIISSVTSSFSPLYCDGSRVRIAAARFYSFSNLAISFLLITNKGVCLSAGLSFGSGVPAIIGDF
jgi:hypothetical protein